MKKKVFLFAVAALALAACSNDETVSVTQSDAIAFRPLATNVTRAADINASTLEGTGFYVSARKHSDNAEYFTDVAYTVFSTPSGIKTWTSANPYYWPGDNSELDFFAYAPKAVGDSHNDQITAHADYKSFEITPSTTAASQVDLIFANENQKKKSTDNAGVVLNFHHAESKIVIMLKNSNPNLTFTVGNVTIGNVKDKGQYVYTGVVDSRLKYTDWGWTGASNTTYTQTVSNGSAYSTSTPAQVGVDMILVPQTLTHAITYASSANGAAFNGSYINVELKIQNATGGAYIIGDGSTFKTALWPLPATEWDPGKKYIYTVDLAGGGYNPTNVNGTDENLDPVLDGAEIKFVTVTVDDWDSQSYTVGNMVFAKGGTHAANIAAEAGEYTITITGLTSGEAISSVSTTVGTVTPTSGTVGTQGTFSFNLSVGANTGSARSVDIVVTGASGATTINLTQAAP
jgi:hypothetical protein